MTPACLGLVEQGDQFVEVLRLGSTDLLHQGLVDPDPVDGMDVDGNGVPFSIGGGELLQRGGNDLSPIALRRQRRNVGKLPGFGVVHGVIAEDLRGGRRIAGRDHGLQRRHRRAAAAAGDWHVFPGVALLGERLLDDVERGCFAARRPPVQHLDFFIVRGRSAAREAQAPRPPSRWPSKWNEFSCYPSSLRFLCRERSGPRFQKPSSASDCWV